MGTEEQTEKRSSRKKTRVLFWLIVLICAVGLGAAAYETMILAGFGKYLAMQSLSDPIHRLAVLVLPVALVMTALTWMLSELGNLWTWLMWTGRAIIALSIVCIFGTLMFVVLFDRRLETEGLYGQFAHENIPVRAVTPLAASDLHGFRREKSAKFPGLAVEELSLKHILTLDRKTIARKTPDGDFVWHMDRPGPPPAYLSLDGDMLYYTGPGPDFEDDVVVCAVELSTGNRRWLFHSLGNWASPVVSMGPVVSFVSARPSSCAIRVLRTDSPMLQWAVRLQGVVKIPPRFRGGKLQVAQGTWLIEFAVETGRELNRKKVCQDTQDNEEDILGIVCKNGIVVAWKPGNSTDERPTIDFR